MSVIEFVNGFGDWYALIGLFIGLTVSIHDHDGSDDVSLYADPILYVAFWPVGLGLRFMGRRYE